MRLFRFLAVVLLLSSSFFSTSCTKEDDPAPVVGTLVVNIPNYRSIVGAQYYLYTEGAWASTRAISPLLEGMVAESIRINDLNAGNYIFTVNGTNPRVVQVSAGRTNTFTYRN